MEEGTEDRVLWAQGEDLAARKLVLAIGARSGSYVWLDPARVAVPPRGSRAYVFQFEARARNDIHVALADAPSTHEGRQGLGDSPLVEVLVGGWRNTKTAVRCRGQQVAVAKGGIRDDQKFRKYWLLVEPAKGAITVGKGRRAVLLRSPERAVPGLADVAVVGLSSWDAPIDFRSFSVLSAGPRDLDALTRCPPSCRALLLGRPLGPERGSLTAAADQPLRPADSADSFADTRLPIRYADGSRSAAAAHRVVLRARAPALAAAAAVGALVDVDALAADVENALLDAIYRAPGAPLPEEEGTDAGRLRAALAVCGVADAPADFALALLNPEDADVTLELPVSGGMSGPFFVRDRAPADAPPRLLFAAAPDGPWFSLAQLVGRGDDGSFAAAVQVRRGADGSPAAVLLPAHRMLLSAASPYFFHLFRAPFLERDAAVVALDAESVPAACALLSYVYTFALPAPSPAADGSAAPVFLVLLGLFALADRLEIAAAADRCQSSLAELLTIDRVADVWAAAIRVGECKLARRCQDFALTHFPALAQSPSFARLDGEMLLALVVRDSLLGAEVDVFRAVVAWGGVGVGGAEDEERRHAQMRAVLCFLRYGLMDIAELDGEVLPHPAVRGCVRVRAAAEAAAEQIRAAAARQREAAELADVEAAAAAAAPVGARPRRARTGSSSLRSSAPAEHEGLYLVGSMVAVPDITRTLRLRPRYPYKGWLKLLFAAPGDSNGLFAYFGRRAAAEASGGGIAGDAWLNPVTAGRGVLKVSASCPPSRYLQFDKLVDNTFRNTSYVTGRPAWVQVELGGGRRFACNHYWIRHDGSLNYLRSWSLRGSDDGEQWTTLSRHVDDTSIRAAGHLAHWPVATVAPHRMFRLQIDGPNAEGTNWLALSAVEFYGFLSV